jgi:hypothetical protein
MTSEQLPAYPPPSFSHRAYGVDLEWFGEDGGMAARGHIPDLRFLAACNHMARTDGGLLNLWDDSTATLADATADIQRVWAIPADPQAYGSFKWAVKWAGITEQTPGAIPLTLLVV